MPHLSPIKRKKFEKFLQFIGCTHTRTKGDHFIFDRVGLDRPVVITADKEVPVFIIRNNLRTLKMTPDEYMAILSKL